MNMIIRRFLYSFFIKCAPLPCNAVIALLSVKCLRLTRDVNDNSTLFFNIESYHFYDCNSIILFVTGAYPHK